MRRPPSLCGQAAQVSDDTQRGAVGGELETRKLELSASAEREKFTRLMSSARRRFRRQPHSLDGFRRSQQPELGGYTLHQIVC